MNLNIVLTLIFGATPLADPTDDPARFRLTPDGPSITTRSGQFVRGYTWLPMGYLPRDERTVRLVDATGRPVPTELRVSGRYSDGSARGIRLAAIVPRQRLAAGSFYTLDRGVAPVPSGAIEVIDDPTGVHVANGVFSVSFSKTGPSLLSELTYRGRNLLHPTRPVEVEGELELGTIESSRDPTRLVRAGTGGEITCVVTQRGELLDGMGDVGAYYDIEWRMIAGASQIEGSILVRGAVDTGIAEDLQLRIPLALRPPLRGHVIAGGGSGGRYKLDRSRLSVLSFDGRQLLVRAGDNSFRIDDGGRRGVRVGDRDGSVALVASRLRALAPREVNASETGELALVLHSGPFFLESGFAATADFAISIGNDREQRKLAEGLSREPAPTLRPVGSDEGEGDATIDRSARLLGIVDAAIDSVSGYVDHGDYRYRNGFANLEYDPAASFLGRFHERGDARHAILARDMLTHWVTYDRSEGEAGHPAGFPWMHGVDHRSFEIEAGHVWAKGLTLGSVILGETRFAQGVTDLRRALLQVASEPGRMVNERSYGWMIIALADLIEHDDMPELRRALIALRSDLIRHYVDPIRSGRRTAGAPPVPWVTAGITVEALYRADRVVPDRDGRDATAVLIGFLEGEARYPDGRFAARLVDSLERRGELERNGFATPIDLAMIAAGLGRGSLLAASPHLTSSFETVLLLSEKGLQTSRISAHQAARGLVALRSIEETLRQMHGN